MVLAQPRRLECGLQVPFHGDHSIVAAFGDLLNRSFGVCKAAKLKPMPSNCNHAASIALSQFRYLPDFASLVAPSLTVFEGSMLTPSQQNLQS